MGLFLVFGMAACGAIFGYQATRVRFSSQLATNATRVVMIGIAAYLVVSAVALFLDPL